MPPELKPCGTNAAYERHRRNGEPIDDACRAAHTEAGRALYARNETTRMHRIATAAARQRALTRLAHLYPKEFAALLAEERAKEEAAS